jgi:hypothetical protein
MKKERKILKGVTEMLKGRGENDTTERDPTTAPLLQEKRQNKA